MDEMRVDIVADTDAPARSSTKLRLLWRREDPLAVSLALAWSCVTDVRNHARWIPLTRMDAGADLSVGDTFAGISGPAVPRGLALVDRMRIERLDPPTATAGGRAVYRKLGPLLLGT